MARSRSRSRSRSPRRERRPHGGGGGGGFRWKDKSRAERDGDDRRGGREGLDRGYNQRPREGRRSRSPRDRRDRDLNREKDRSRDRDRDRERDRAERKTGAPTKKQSSTKPAATSAPAPAAPSGGASGEPLIIVNVNDRLGTKAAIPCLASDPIALFKAQVAARVGRQPHEILLKRQGERPFKDQLTLEDYGVSNGVQLDLELDTGD